MKRYLSLASIALAASLLAASAASAVTFTFDGGTAFGPLSKFNPRAADADLPAAPQVLTDATLGLSGKGRVTYTYAGTEAGYRNTFHVDNVAMFDNKVDARGTRTELLQNPGRMDFSFKTARPAYEVANGDMAGIFGGIAFFKISDTSVYALFNDTWRGDRDFDDMAVRMDVAPVPLPAAAWLLLGGLGVLGATARRKAAAA